MERPIPKLPLAQRDLSCGDHMSCAHAFARLDSLYSGCGRHNCRKIEDVTGHLDGSAADSSAAVDLVASQPLYTKITSISKDGSKAHDVQSVFRRSRLA